MKIGRSVRRSGLSTWREGPALTAAIVLLLVPACSDMPPSMLVSDLDRSTLSETIDTGVDAVIEPAELDVGISELPPGDGFDVSIEAGPGFCCNPLTIEFRAVLADAGQLPSLNLTWDFGDGRNGTGRVVQHTYNFSGVYDVAVKATLPDGRTMDAIKVLHAGNDGPQLQDDGIAPAEVGGTAPTVVAADAGEDTTTDAGALVTLDGSASVVSPPGVVSYLWTQLEGPPIALDRRDVAITSFIAPTNLVEAETATFSLLVSAGGVTESDTVTITVMPQIPVGGGGPPGGVAPIVVTARAGPDQVVEEGDLVHLTAGASSTSGPGPLSFVWSQVTGSAMTLNDPTLVAPSFSASDAVGVSETLVFRVIVSDGAVTDSDDVTITVNPSVVGDDEAEILAALKVLPPLQKTHYSWPIGPNLIADPNNPLLFEYVRITHAVTLAGGAPKAHRVDAAVQVCKAVNAMNPAIPATIAIKYSPWHEVFPASFPPTDVGPYHDQEIAQFQDYMLLFRQWLDEAYVTFDAVIPVSALVFDSERFVTKDLDEAGAAAWNAAMDQKYDAFYTIGKSVFPDARIEWFGRGAVQPCTDITRWCAKRLFTLDEMGETFNCALYIPYNVPLMVDTFRQTHQNATAHGVGEVMLWVSLGAAWDENRRWKMHWDYDTENSWLLGAQINDPFYGDRPDEYAPWHDAPFVCFYPQPFYDKTPHWGRHFVAYVKGAHGIAN